MLPSKIYFSVQYYKICEVINPKYAIFENAFGAIIKAIQSNYIKIQDSPKIKGVKFGMRLSRRNNIK